MSPPLRYCLEEHSAEGAVRGYPEAVVVVPCLPDVRQADKPWRMSHVCTSELHGIEYCFNMDLLMSGPIDKPTVGQEGAL